MLKIGKENAEDALGQAGLAVQDLREGGREGGWEDGRFLNFKREGGREGLPVA